MPPAAAPPPLMEAPVQPPPQPGPSALARSPLTPGERLGRLVGLALGAIERAARAEVVGQVIATAQGIGSAVKAGLGAAGETGLDEYGKDPALEQSLSPLTDFFYERYWRVTVERADLVPSGPAVLVANHSGAIPFDGPVLRQALRRERPGLPDPRWLLEDQVLATPFMGTLLNRLGAIRACPESALRLLSEGRAVIVFPEGVRGLSKPFSERYRLRRMGRGGFVKLALRAGAPIVPVAVVGAEESSPMLASLPGRLLGLPYLPLTTPPLPAKWTIRFGEPLLTGTLGPAAAEDPAEVERLVEQTRGRIEGMLRALLEERRSVFGG